MKDFEKRIRRKRVLTEAVEVIVSILIVASAIGSVALSIFLYSGLFASNIPEWMKWTLLLLR